MSNEKDYKLVYVYCYKKRVSDSKLVLIGEIFHYEGEDRKFFAPWNPKIVGVEQLSKSSYLPDFYDKEGNILEVDSHAYNVQLYLEPPSDNFLSTVGNFPLTTGMVDVDSVTYWDTYVDNRVIEICYQTNELNRELRKLRGVE